uniref:Uncharacterized protein n=1 Tax=Chenopodium quinoa TaxID=63459 RepID=A0A803MV84_CHEQI
MMNNKLQLFNVFFLIVATIVATKLILKTLLIKSSKRLPPVVKGRIPLIGGVARFVANPVEMLKEEYESLGSVFTINAVYKNITFLLEPDVSAYFFKAGESELSQKEVYGFTVPIFGPGIVYDAEYSVRKEQFHFFEESFRIDKLRGFVDYMSQEVQGNFGWFRGGGLKCRAVSVVGLGRGGLLRSCGCGRRVVLVVGQEDEAVVGAEAWPDDPHHARSPHSQPCLHHHQLRPYSPPAAAPRQALQWLAQNDTPKRSSRRQDANPSKPFSSGWLSRPHSPRLAASFPPRPWLGTSSSAALHGEETSSLESEVDLELSSSLWDTDGSLLSLESPETDYFSKWGDNGEVDLKQEMENLIILIASRCFLGQEVRESLSEDIAALINEINVAMGPLTTMFPHLPTPPHWRRDKARKKLDDIFSNVISSRRLSPKSEDDMLQSLINSKYKDGRATTVTEVTGMLITALYGGQRSGSATATWTGAYLVHYKAIWFDAVEEQRRLMKKHGDAITYDAISDMHHLYRCIKEALRLHPPLAMLLRKSHKDFSVTTRKGDKYDIPKGHIIAASPVLSNRVPHIYTNPDSYDPERFCPGREEDRLAGPFSFVSFGGGKHTCLGETFAYLEIKTIWSYLIRNFEIELITPFPETEYNEIVWSPKGKVMVRYKRRKLVIE